MDDVLLWISITSSIILGLTVGFVAWNYYVVLETQRDIDELESRILALLDDALQMLIPTPILNNISQFDIGNFEMNSEPAGKDKNKAWLSFLTSLQEVRYAEDVSLPLSEREQMYKAFGDSEKVREKKDPVDGTTEVERRASMHWIDVKVSRGSKSPLERKSKKRPQEKTKEQKPKKEPKKPSKKLTKAEEQKTQMSSKTVKGKTEEKGKRKESKTEKKKEKNSKTPIKDPSTSPSMEKSSKSVQATQKSTDEA